MTEAVYNPLRGIEIGSVLDDTTGRFSGTVIEPGITRQTNGFTNDFKLTGLSDYAYSDTMNQGSVAMSGKLGVKGITKFRGLCT